MFYFANGGSYGNSMGNSLGNSAASIGGGEQSLPSVLVRLLKVEDLGDTYQA